MKGIQQVDGAGRPRRQGRSHAALARQLACALLWLGVAWPARTSAAEPESPPSKPDPDLTQLSVEELASVQVATVYGASRYEQEVRRAPASVSFVTAEEIKQFGYRTLGDVLGSVRGISINSDRNYSYFGIRGFNRPGDYNSRVLVMVDGHRLNDNIYDGALLGTEGLVDVDLIDRVEVIRGPSSSVYGNNAFFGVVNIITKRGRQLDGVEVSGEGGSSATYQGRFSVGQRFDNEVEFLLSGTYYQSEGAAEIYYPEFDDPATSLGVAHHDDQDQAYRFLTSLSYHDFTLAGAYSRREKDVPTASYGTAFNLSREYTVDSRGFVDLKYERELGNDFYLTARTYYDRYEYSGDYPYDTAAPGAPPDILINRDEVVGDWVGAEAQLNWKLFERHTVIAGSEVRENLRQAQRNFDVNPHAVYVDSDRSSTSWGVYAQGEAQLLTNLVINAGLRYDHFESFGDTVNPRFGVLYTPWTPTTFKFLYGEAYRAPNAFEFYYESGGSAKRNPDLHAEEIRTYELVLEQALPAHLALNAAGYYYRINDLISQTVDPGDGLLVFENLDEVNAFGGEVELAGRFPNHASFRTSYAIQRAEDGQTGDTLSNAPRHLAKFNVVLPLFEDKLMAGFELQYTSPTETVRGSRVDDYWVANLTFLTQKIVHGVELSASIYNLFDAEYGHAGSAEHVQEVIPQPGRQFRVKLTCRF